jgi:hypothetical protein
MPIDASIYSQLGRTTPLEGPLDQFGRAMQVKNLMGQSQLQGLQIGQAQQGIDEQQKLRALFGGGGTPTTQQVMAVSPTSGIAYGKSQAELQAARANLLKQDSELIKSFGEQAKNELITVTDQPSWDKYRALQRQRASLLSTPQFQQVALEALQKDPDVFDPSIIQAKLAAGTAAPAGHTRMPGGGLSPVDPQYVAGRTAIAKAGAPQLTVPIDMRAQSKFADTVGTKTAERVIGQHDAAEAAVENLQKLDLTLKQITESDAITGMGAEIFKNLERFKQLVLQDKASGKKVSDTELLDALMGSDVFPMIKALGIGARGLDTPAEREFLRSVMTGVLPMNKETLRRMTEIRRNVSVRAIEKWNKKVDSGELDNYFKASGIPKGKIEMPSVETTPAQGASPQLGQREDGYIYKGGDPAQKSSWEKAR